MSCVQQLGMEESKVGPANSFTVVVVGGPVGLAVVGAAVAGLETGKIWGGTVGCCALAWSWLPKWQVKTFAPTKPAMLLPAMLQKLLAGATGWVQWGPPYGAEPPHFFQLGFEFMEQSVSRGIPFTPHLGACATEPQWM
mmetsp:Transcript_84305/g.195998  ORF Transcript_84305/g.195998 Transcript_84305/m.195998 type:complete len:139 (+) Transcript_84305:628-1044(+)